MLNAYLVHHRTAREPARADPADLLERLEAAESERRRAQAAMVDLEEKLSDAINVCVALERLHGSTDHGEVLRAIQDVVVNLVGSEEVAVFERGANGELVAVQSVGVEPGKLGPVTPGQGPIGRAAAEGKPWVIGDGGEPGDPDLTACVPLVAEDRVVAVLAIWRLLPHKQGLRTSDRQVLELLGPHAGRALYLTAQGRPAWAA